MNSDSHSVSVTLRISVVVVAMFWSSVSRLLVIITIIIIVVVHLLLSFSASLSLKGLSLASTTECDGMLWRTQYVHCIHKYSPSSPHHHQPGRPTDNDKVGLFWTEIVRKQTFLWTQFVTCLCARKTHKIYVRFRWSTTVWNDVYCLPVSVCWCWQVEVFGNYYAQCIRNWRATRVCECVCMCRVETESLLFVWICAIGKSERRNQSEMAASKPFH